MNSVIFVAELLQNSKIVWSNVCTPTIFIFFSYIFNALTLFQKWERLSNVRHIYNVLQKVESYIFKLNNLYIILGLLTLYHKHGDVLFVFIFFIT